MALVSTILGHNQPKKTKGGFSAFEGLVTCKKLERFVQKITMQEVMPKGGCSPVALALAFDGFESWALHS